ncbi:hypothetical protein [Methylibium rhizosphaerae]|uniref:hypothetical protein n=1 Tax=Methylibium rhizosphaerae TaxID=2570323 RepID=UPI001126CBA0|nr:hypothetical protein [Methylibium rhizosphaerae]
MKTSSLVIAVAVGTVALSAPVQARVLSGFEQGLGDWGYMGDVSIQTSTIGLDPTQGPNMAFISTMCDRLNPPLEGAPAGRSWPCDTTTNEHPYSGVSSPDVSFSREFLGLPTDRRSFLESMPPIPYWTAAGVGESGAIRTSFYAPQAGELTFDWDKIGVDDTAYFSLWSDDGTYRQNDWFYYYESFSGSFMTSGVDLCSRYYTEGLEGGYCGGMNLETGWHSRSISVPGPGLYWIGFALSERLEGTVPSVLALDNVRFSVAAPVPEAATYSMWGLGLVMAIVVRHRRRKCNPALGAA